MLPQNPFVLYSGVDSTTHGRSLNTNSDAPHPLASNHTDRPTRLTETSKNISNNTVSQTLFSVFPSQSYSHLVQHNEEMAESINESLPTSNNSIHPNFIEVNDNDLHLSHSSSDNLLVLASTNRFRRKNKSIFEKNYTINNDENEFTVNLNQTIPIVPLQVVSKQRRKTEHPMISSYSKFITFSTPTTLMSCPDHIIYTILEYLKPTEILSKFSVLNLQCYFLASKEELWECRLQKLYHIFDLLRIQPQPVAERRSKGRVQLAQLMGTHKEFLVRTVSLETTNAGKDDGIPTSCLREVSLLTGIEHPNITQCYGATVNGSELRIISEYIGPSLLTHMTQNLDLLSLPNNHLVIKSIMYQLLSGVNCLHCRGIMHRNIKSDNIVLGPGNGSDLYCLKICDLAMGRTVDLPLGMYTPEDPKERDRSYREQRRLYNRAPELILRQPVYGLEVDIWSVGCLFLEIALGTPPFRCESEIGLLMSTLQLCGTPDVSLWDRLSSAPKSFLKLPQWDPIDFRAVAAVLDHPVWYDQGIHAPPLLRYKSQSDSLKILLHFGNVVGIAGLHLLERLLIIPGCFRVSAAEALSFPYFSTDYEMNKKPYHPIISNWLQSWYIDQENNQHVIINGSTNICVLPALKHYNRFFDVIKTTQTAVPHPNILQNQKLSLPQTESKTGIQETIPWSLIKIMEASSVRVPIHFDHISAIHFDFTEELDQLRAYRMRMDVSHMHDPVLFPVSQLPSSVPTYSTPAPRRTRRLLRRRRDSHCTTTISNACVQTCTMTTQDTTHISPLASLHSPIIVSSNQHSSQEIDIQAIEQSIDCPIFLDTTTWENDYTDTEFETDYYRKFNLYDTEHHYPHESIINHTTDKFNQIIPLSSALNPYTSQMNEFGTSDFTLDTYKIEQNDEESLSSPSANSGEPITCCHSDHIRSSPVILPVIRGKRPYTVCVGHKEPVRLIDKKLFHQGRRFLRGPAESWIARNSRHGLHFLASLTPYQSRQCPTVNTGQYGIHPRVRLDIVNYLLGVQPEFLLKSQTLHLAVGYFDRYTSFFQDSMVLSTTGDLIAPALACLKIGDLYNEVSKEYYKQDNVSEYAEFSASPPAPFEEMRDASNVKLIERSVTAAELLLEEKKIINVLRFNVAIPTICWFVDAFLSVAKLLHLTYLVDYCHYLADLSLYSHQIIAFRPALISQVILLFSCCSLFRPIRKQKVDSPPVIIRPCDPEYPPLLEQLLKYFVQSRDIFCENNCVWETLDCVAIMRDLLLNGRRYFETLGTRSVERIHPWVGRLGIPTPTIPAKLVKCIIPTSQDSILSSLS